MRRHSKRILELRRWIYGILEQGPVADGAGRVVDRLLMALILVGVLIYTRALGTEDLV